MTADMLLMLWRFAQEAGSEDLSVAASSFSSAVVPLLPRSESSLPGASSETSSMSDELGPVEPLDLPSELEPLRGRLPDPVLRRMASDLRLR